MKIAMLSWRSPGHPQQGGAETVTQEVLKRLVQRGHEVTWFSALWPGAAPEEVIDGVRVVRAGRQWSVHARAWRWLRRRADEFDVVVDQINTIPFFTPLYVAKSRRRMFIHQTAREFWWRQTPGPFKLIAPIGYLAEPWYLRLYRGTLTITVSASTRDELVGLGLQPAAITIMPQANTFEAATTLQPKDGPTRLIAVGRLEPAKHFEDVLLAFFALQRQVPDAVLDIVGSGAPEYRDRLDRLAADHGADGVTFHGWVDESRKHELMVQAHVHVFCSRREGWGLTVTEAAALGTPSVGYDVPGVRDSIADPRLLVPRGDVAALACRIVALAGDAVLYADARTQAWDRARALSYEATTDVFEEALRG